MLQANKKPMIADQTLKKIETLSLIGQPSKIVAQPIARLIIRLRIIGSLFQTARVELRSSKKAMLAIRLLRQKYQTFFKESMYQKITKIDNRYYWRIAAPGFPSEALRNIQSEEIRRVSQTDKQRKLRLLMLSVTSKCALNCEHCYEWKNLNKRDVFSRSDLERIIREYQTYGTGIVFLGGGEPMLRLKDICHVLRHARKNSEFWMYTSGFHLGEKEATQLKRAGLTGVIVSLDHFSEQKHDHFRGYPGAFKNAINAVYACHQCGLGTALALCTTNEFTTESNFRSYMEMANQLGVHFVQLLEPKAAGRYSGKKVLLEKTKQKWLEKWTNEYNQEKKFRSYPIINYPESVNRKIGCLSGDRMIFINSAGEIQQCPFCERTLGNALEYPVDEVLTEMQKMPCADFQKSEL